MSNCSDCGDWWLPMVAVGVVAAVTVGGCCCGSGGCAVDDDDDGNWGGV